MSGSLASWQNCAKVRSSWTRWKNGTVSSARRCDTSCTGASFSHHYACDPPEPNQGLKIFPAPWPCLGPTAGFRINSGTGSNKVVVNLAQAGSSNDVLARDQT